MDAEQPTERERIIEEATRWFLANRDADSDRSSDDFLAWLRVSPAHVREYLGVSSVARDLPSACYGLDTLEGLISRARLDRSDSALIAPTQPRALRSGRLWVALPAGLAAAAALGFLSYSRWYHQPPEGSTPSPVAT